MASLTEDEVDDLIYFARANEADDFTITLNELTAKASTSALAVLSAAVDAGKNTPLHMAAGNGHKGIVSIILEQIKAKDGAGPAGQAFLDATNSFGNTALHWAAMNGHLDVVKLLVETGGASPALANDKNYVPLDLAGLNDKVAVVDYFLASAEKAEKAEEAAAAATTSKTAETLDKAAANLDLNKEVEESGDADEEEDVVVMTAKREGDEIVFSAEKK